MNDTTLITIDDIKNVTSISNNIDVELLEPYLYQAQDYIREVVGDAMYDAMIAEVAAGTGSTYTSLIENYVMYALGFAAWFDAAPFLHIKTQRKGVVLQASDNSTNATPEEFSIYIGRIEGLMRKNLRKLKEYLDDNKDTYSLYRTSDQINPQSSSSIFLGFQKKSNKSRYDTGDCIDC